MSQGGIARWVDRSGNAHHLIQSSPSGRPDLDVVGWNGNKPTVKFNGTEFLTVETWSGSPAGTNAGLTVLAVMRSGDARDAAVAAWWNESGDGALAGVRAVGGLTLLDFRRLDDLTRSQSLAGDRDLGSGRHAVVWRFAPSTQTVTLTVDGAHIATSYEARLGELLLAPLVVGAATPLGAGSFLGEISELVIVGADISDENVQGFTSYAKKRWGGLPASSPGGLCRKADREPTPVGISCDDGIPTPLAISASSALAPASPRVK